MFYVWLCMSVFGGIVLELAFGFEGLIVPVFASCSFYFLVLCGWRLSFPFLAVCGSLLDLAFGRHFPVQLFVLAALVPMSSGWRRHGDCVHWVLQAIPGFLVGLVSGSLTLLLVRFPGAVLDWGFVWRNVWLLFQFSIGGGLCFPVVSCVLDRLALRFDFPRYGSVQKVLG